MFGAEAVALMLAFTIAGLNVYTAKSFRRMLKAEKQRAAGPKTREKRRKGTFDQVLGPAVEASIGPNGDDPAGRAPP